MTEPFVAPDYRGRSLGDVLPAIASALGVDAGLPLSAFELPSAQSYVVFLVDGLGYEQLRDHAEDAPYLHSLLDGQPPATAGVPSTTATSLTSLGTALTPGEHGLVGYTSRIPGTNRLLNALSWDSRVDPAVWQPHETAFARLAGVGVHATVVNKRDFERSGLTNVGQRGAQFVGVDGSAERLAAVAVSSGKAPSLTYMYDGDLDWTGHKHGVASSEWEQQLSMIDFAAERLRETLPSSTRIVVVADHGMVDSPATDRIEVDDLPELRDGVAVIGGEGRFRHLYCRSGAVDDVASSWRAVLGDRAEVVDRDGAEQRGWFGTVGPEVRPRLGDVMVACRGTFAVMSSADFPNEAKLIGMHGSMTSAEMLIPVLVA